MIGVASVKIANTETIVYINDDIYDNGINIRDTSGSGINDIVSEVNYHLNDSAFWFLCTVPLHPGQTETYNNYIKALFPTAYLLETVQSYVERDVTFYDLLSNTNKAADHFYKDSTGRTHSILSSASSVSTGPTIITGIPMFSSADFDFDNKILKTGAVMKYLRFQFNPNSWVLKIDISGTYTDGNTQDYYLTGKTGRGDPYTPGEEGDIDGPSGPGGGEGDHDTTSDPIAIPNLPTKSAVDTGFITLFRPSLGELRALADYMWNGLFDINNLKKLFADPMDVILGLSIVPGPVPAGSQADVSIGNISTGVSMTKAADQFFTVDCGTLKPTEFWGAYLDYSPYTKVDIYLPFIGMRSLSIDDVMEKNVNVVYHVDILSGACVAFIKSGDQVLYTHIGQCASSIPINGNDWTNTINGILSMAAAIAGTVATGGAAAPMLMGQAANITNILKPSVARSGGMGGMGGMLGIQKPYLILTRPRQCVPGNQNIYKGYPAFITRALGDLSGMTSVEDIHLAVAGATQEELEEIERLLKEGVML